MIDSGVVNATQEVAIEWLREGRRFVQALLIEVEGSAPLPEGAMLVVDEQGTSRARSPADASRARSSPKPRR